MRSETTGCHNVTIENGSAGDGDVDNLVIKGASSGDFKIYISGGNNEDLVIQDNIPYNNSDYIVIHDWANHGFETVTFDDKTLTNEEIYAFLADQDHEIHMNQSMSYEAGQWKDVFIYDGTGLDTTITGYVAGEDKLKFTDQSISKVEASGNDALLTLTDGGTIIVKNMAGKGIDYLDSSGELHSVTAHITQQSVIRSLMQALDDSTLIMESVESAMNEVVNYASWGKYSTWNSLVNSFISDVQTYAKMEEGNNSDTLSLPDGSKIVEPGIDRFLQNYCGINLMNDDTGSITGLDAGGSIAKTAESIIPENGTLNTLIAPSSDSTVINGVAFHWPEADSVAKQTMINAVNTWWAKEGLDLIEESYGLSLMEEDSSVNEIQVNFVDLTNSQKPDVHSGLLAYVTYTPASDGINKDGINTNMRLNINMEYYNEILDENGASNLTTAYLDRTIAHELTHAVMAANITGFSDLPQCISEGSAELVHGIDDVRFSDILTLSNLGIGTRTYTDENGEKVTVDVTAQRTQNLQDALSLTGDSRYAYAGGYMLLRYFAKQVADSFDESVGSVNSAMLASTVVDSVTSAASSLWSETTAAVADTGSELASSMVSISNAMLTPLDSTDSNVFGSGSLASDLFSDKKNNGFIS